MKPPVTEAEQELLERVRAWPGQFSWKSLDTCAMQVMACTQGHDFATALLYDRLVNSSEQGPWIRHLDSFPMGQACPPEGAILALVPGACYREYPQTGADGLKLRQAAETWGWQTEVVPLESFGRQETNARILLDWLNGQRGRPVYLVSLSKGAADVRTALESPEADQAFQDVEIWISLSGIPFGTALAGFFLQKWQRRLVARSLCWYHGFEFDVIRKLNLRPHARLKLPAGLPVIHVVGFPLLHHLASQRARFGQDRLKEHGPSDGGGILLGDVTRLPGMIYPVWGADHYLDPPWDVRPMIRRFLQFAVDHRARKASHENPVVVAGR